MEYRKDIQGLRAIAIILVFIFHLNPFWLPGGFIGVDIFFVLSGFLISSIILAQKENGKFSFTDFYFKRIRRIVPAYFLMLAVTGVAGAMILIGKDVGAFRRELLHAIVFDTDRIYANFSSYFGVPLQQHPLLHTWSIAVEMKFYLLLPLLLIIVPKKYLTAVISVLALGLLAFAFYVLEIRHNSNWVYFALPVRVPEFLMGTLLVLKQDIIIEKFKKFSTVSGYLGIIILLFSACFFSNDHFAGLLYVLPCIGTALLLLWEDSPVNRFLKKTVFVQLGTFSYSIYLWHFPVIALMRYYSGDRFFGFNRNIFIIVLTAVLSYTSYILVENVLRKKKKPSFWYAMIPLIIFPVMAYFSVLGINKHFSTIPPEFTGPVFGVKSHATGKVETFGDMDKKPEMVLIGNSHALCLKPYLDYLGKKNGFSFTTITTNSYPAIPGLDENEISQKGRYGDYENAKKSFGLTQKEIQDKKIIVIAMSSWVMVSSLKSAIENVAKNLRADQELILITPFPTVSKDPLQVNRDVVKNKEKKQTYTVRYRDEEQNLNWVEQKYSNVHFLDFSKNEVFKDAPFYHDTIMYYDKNHINLYGSRLLAKSTESEFMRLIHTVGQ